MIIDVRAEPAPQGSKRHVGNGRMVESSAKVGPWREAVRTETQRELCKPGVVPIAAGVPVSVLVTFFLRRPASAPKRVTVPAKRPDLDKLVRSTLDGLTMAGVFADDCQVVSISAHKRFADTFNGTHVGATIIVQAVDS